MNENEVKTEVFDANEGEDFDPIPVRIGETVYTVKHVSGKMLRQIGEIIRTIDEVGPGRLLDLLGMFFDIDDPDKAFGGVSALVLRRAFTHVNDKINAQMEGKVGNPTEGKDSASPA